MTLEDVVACYDGAADEETALLQARRHKTEQLKADRNDGRGNTCINRERKPER